MGRGQCAIICALLGAIAVGVFVLAYDQNVGALSGGQEIKQHVRGIYVGIGAVACLVLGWLFSPQQKPTGPAKPLEPF